MNKILDLQNAIYDQFQKSPAAQQYFILAANRDAYAAYYTSMYLIQDTAEAVYAHMAHDFSPDPMQAYIEFWGVMQAIVIQQDAIGELHTAVEGTAPAIPKGSAWKKLREKRNLCAGHPANHGRLGAPQRTFMGRNFGKYNRITYELYDPQTRITNHPTFDLRQMINDYDIQASAVLQNVLSAMRTRWP